MFGFVDVGLDLYIILHQIVISRLNITQLILRGVLAPKAGRRHADLPEASRPIDAERGPVGLEVLLVVLSVDFGRRASVGESDRDHVVFGLLVDNIALGLDLRVEGDFGL